MWIQNINPLNNSLLSGLVAALPIVVFLLCLVLFKLSGIKAGLIALGVEFVVALVAFSMPVSAALGAALSGVLIALWPISLIIVMAVWLYRLSVASGHFDVIRASISAVSADQRVQVLLITFAFGAFLEGAAGFGVPIAICAALLVQLGFKPVKAAMIALVANVAAGAYGAIGVPVLVGASVSNLGVMALSRSMVILLQPLTLLVPFLLVFILDGVRGLRETLPATITSTLVFSGVQASVLWFLGPELADLGAGLCSMIALMVLSHFWSPRRIYRESTDATAATTTPTFKEALVAWSPFYILTAFILVWSIPAVKALFTRGALKITTFSIPIPGLTGQIMTASGAVVQSTWVLALLGATGTAVFFAVLLTFFTTPKINTKIFFGELKATLKMLCGAIILIAIILMIANIANYSGGSKAMGTALASVGPIFPLIAPVIGWIGVFLTGSVVNNNTLFAPLQVATAQGIQVEPALLVGANTAGGTTAKVISPQSIAIAAGAVGLNGRESEIMRAAIGYSLVMLLIICGWSLVLAVVVF